MEVGAARPKLVDDSNPIINSIVRQIAGNLNHEDCDTLWGLVSSLPSGSTILDVNPGEGRSSVLLSKALGDRKATILSVGMTRKELNSFAGHAASFQVGPEVVPILAGLNAIRGIFSKRSVNLVLLQLPPFNPDNLSTIDAVLPFLKSVVRAQGFVAIVCPTGGHTEFVSSNAEGFDVIHETGRLIVLRNCTVPASVVTTQPVTPPIDTPPSGGNTEPVPVTPPVHSEVEHFGILDVPEKPTILLPGEGHREFVLAPESEPEHCEAPEAKRRGRPRKES